MNPITKIAITFADGTTQSFSEEVAVVPATPEEVPVSETGAPVVESVVETNPS